MERGEGVGGKGREREVGKKGDRERFDVNKMIFNIIIF